MDSMSMDLFALNFHFCHQNFWYLTSTKLSKTEIDGSSEVSFSKSSRDETRLLHQLISSKAFECRLISMRSLHLISQLKLCEQSWIDELPFIDKSSRLDQIDPQWNSSKEQSRFPLQSKLHSINTQQFQQLMWLVSSHESLGNISSLTVWYDHQGQA